MEEDKKYKEALVLLEKSLKEHYWNKKGEGDDFLSPVSFLFELLSFQKMMKISEKDAFYEGGAEFNRSVLNITGRRHNDSVEEANNVFKAGKTIVSILYNLSEQEQEERKQYIVSKLTEEYEKYKEGKAS